MSFKRFGIMLDCSRNAVFKPCQVNKFVDYISKMGYNSLLLYIEDIYEVKDEEYFGYMRGKYLKSEIRDMDAHAKEKGVELIPCIQTLGHFSAPFKTPAYDSMWDVPEVLMVGENRTYEFIENLIKACADNFSTRYINIGMDEALRLGHGRYFKKHGLRDKTTLMVEHLKRVADICKKYGFDCTMWSDMFIRPTESAGERVIPQELIDEIPDNVGLSYWDYQTTDKQVYDQMFREHNKVNRPVWYAGAAWTWVGFAPLADYSVLPFKTGVTSAKENGVENVLVTMWGDGECSSYSHLQTLFAFRRFADGITDMRLIKKEFKKLFGYRYEDFDLMQELNFTKHTDYGTLSALCRTALYQDCFLGVYDEDIRFEGMQDYIALSKKLNSAGKRVKEFRYIFDMLSALSKVLDVKATIGIRLRDSYKKGDKESLQKIYSDFNVIKKRVKVFIQKFEILWETENKPFGLEIHSTRLGGLLERVDYCQRKLKKYLDGKIDKIEELEEKVLPYGYPEEIKFGETRYSYLISRGIL